MSGPNQNSSDKKILLRGSMGRYNQNKSEQKTLPRGNMGGPNQNSSDKKNPAKGRVCKWYLYSPFISDPSFLYLMEIKDLRVLENRFVVLFMTDP